MVVRVGPVPSASALAWVVYARRVLAGAVPDADDLPALDDAVVTELSHLLDEWEVAARRSDELVWVAEIAPERVEFLVHTFHRMAEALAKAAERRGGPVAPEEGAAFYRSLVGGVLESLAGEDASTSELAEMLGQAWPGIEPD